MQIRSIHPHNLLDIKHFQPPLLIPRFTEAIKNIFIKSISRGMQYNRIVSVNTYELRWQVIRSVSKKDEAQLAHARPGNPFNSFHFLSFNLSLLSRSSGTFSPVALLLSYSTATLLSHMLPPPLRSPSPTLSLSLRLRALAAAIARPSGGCRVLRGGGHMTQHRALRALMAEAYNGSTCADG